MLRENKQMKLSLSPYTGLYDRIISKDHLLRQIKENIDFNLSYRIAFIRSGKRA